MREGLGREWSVGTLLVRLTSLHSPEELCQDQDESLLTFHALAPAITLLLAVSLGVFVGADGLVNKPGRPRAEKCGWEILPSRSFRPAAALCMP